MTRQFRVRFYRIAINKDRERQPTAIAGQEILRSLLSTEEHPQLELASDFFYQLREIVKHDGGSVSGCFARLRPDAPHIIEASTGKESQIPLSPGDKILEKSYFIYNPKASLLVFQINRDGGSLSRFMEYINRTLPDKHLAIREDIIKHDVIEKLGKTDVKWLEVTFVRPRNALKANPNDWSKNTISSLNGVNADRLKLRVHAPKNQTLGDKALGLIHNFIKDDEPAGLKVKLEDMVDPIDLLSEVVQDKIRVTLFNGYPDPNAVINELREAYRRQQTALQMTFGNAEPIPEAV